MATVLETISSTFATACPPLRSARCVLSFDQARSLAKQHGTPLLAVSPSALTDNYRTLTECLPGVELFYAAKANPDPLILSTLAGLGSSVDVCTHREAQAALAAGFSPDRMIHTHPCKTLANLTDCYADGIRWFTFDNELELDKFVGRAPDASLLLRLGVSSTSSVINLSAKFGAAPRNAQALLRAAQQRGLSVRGVSFHVGSQCLAAEDFLPVLTEVRKVWDRAIRAGFDLQVLDIGGGLPAPYREGIRPLERYCQILSGALQQTFGDLRPRIIAEPGRGVCAEAVTLVTQVIGKSVRKGVNWYIIDDGLYGSFSGKVYDHADFTLVAEDAGTRPLRMCVVAGPTCDSTDVVAKDQRLPNLEVGELLLVPTMGAYTSASASNFNGLDLARSVAVD